MGRKKGMGSGWGEEMGMESGWGEEGIRMRL